jgi:hypothetical protein
VPLGVLAVAAASSSSLSDVEPGVLGFLIVAAMGAALVFLLRSMNKQFRKITPEPGPDPSGGKGAPGGAPGLADGASGGASGGVSDGASGSVSGGWQAPDRAEAPK